MPERNGSATTMMYVMPVMIFFFALFSASGVALYWVTSNAYQVGQTYLLNNPSRLSQSVKQKEQASRDMEIKRRALNKARKENKKEVDIWSYILEQLLKKIQKGLNDLIPRMKAHITVVAREKKGFLGLFGKTSPS